MSPSTLFRLGGLAILLSGVLVAAGWVIPSFGGPGPVPNTLNLLSLVLALLGVTGLYLRQREASGSLGVVGYIVLMIGLALVTGVIYANTFVLSLLSESQQKELLAGVTGPAFLFSGFVMLVGVILFGIATFRAGVFPRVPAVLVIIGAVPLSLVPLFPLVAVAIGAVLFGAGLIWFGYALWSGQDEKEAYISR